MSKYAGHNSSVTVNSTPILVTDISVEDGCTVIDVSDTGSSGKFEGLQGLQKATLKLKGHIDTTAVLSGSGASVTGGDVVSAVITVAPSKVMSFTGLAESVAYSDTIDGSWQFDLSAVGKITLRLT